MGYITKKTKFEPKLLNKKKLLLLILPGVLCLIAGLMIIVLDPLMLIIGYYSRITNGSYVHELLQREIKGIHLSAYLFNITNPKEFVSGEDYKLKVEEIGPFTYQEIRTNDNLEIDSNAQVLRYTPRIRTVFIPEESVGRPEDVVVTMPNIAVLSVASKLSDFAYIPRMGFNLLAYQYQSKATVTMNVHDYLWGYDEPFIKLGNKYIPGIITFDTLGILDRLYDKNAVNTYELSIREKDKFAIKSLNGVKGLKMWDYENSEKRSSCNSFLNAYEGIAYPRKLQPETPLRLYRGILCRFLELDYVGKRTMEYGIEGLFYKISNKTFTISNDTECLCNKGVCTEGISDLSPCVYGLPLVLSNPHFMNADPKLYERVEGLVPKEKENDSGFTIDPEIGTVLTTQFSVQINIMVRDVGFNTETSKFSNMLVPVAYFKILQAPLTPEENFDLRFVHIYGPYLKLFMQILLLSTGLVLLAYAARILYGSCSYSEKTLHFHVKVKEKLSVERPLMS